MSQFKERENLDPYKGTLENTYGRAYNVTLLLFDSDASFKLVVLNRKDIKLLLEAGNKFIDEPVDDITESYAKYIVDGKLRDDVVLKTIEDI